MDSVHFSHKSQWPPVFSSPSFVKGGTITFDCETCTLGKCSRKEGIWKIGPYRFFPKQFFKCYQEFVFNFWLCNMVEIKLRSYKIYFFDFLKGCFCIFGLTLKCKSHVLGPSWAATDSFVTTMDIAWFPDFRVSAAVAGCGSDRSRRSVCSPDSWATKSV